METQGEGTVWFTNLKGMGFPIPTTKLLTKQEHMGLRLQFQPWTKHPHNFIIYLTDNLIDV